MPTITEQLIAILEVRLVNISGLKTAASQIGDVDQLAALEQQEAETNEVLTKLKG